MPKHTPFRFKPRKRRTNDGFNKVLTNGELAESAQGMLNHAALDCGVSADTDCAIQDALSNLFHLCDKLHHDVDQEIENAKTNWQAER